MEEEGCMEYMRTLLRDNELFRTYVTVSSVTIKLIPNSQSKQCLLTLILSFLFSPLITDTSLPLFV